MEVTENVAKFLVSKTATEHRNIPLTCYEKFIYFNQSNILKCVLLRKYIKYLF